MFRGVETHSQETKRTCECLKSFMIRQESALTGFHDLRVIVILIQTRFLFLVELVDALLNVSCDAGGRIAMLIFLPPIAYRRTIQLTAVGDRS